MGGMGGVVVIRTPRTNVASMGRGLKRGSIFGTGTSCELSRLLFLSLATKININIPKF
jgi:hypothetical protein